MTVIEAIDDAALAQVPNRGAVFLLWPPQGEPYLGRTTVLRRRLLRMLRRYTVRRIEYELTGSPLESSVRLYELARLHFPEQYLERLKLRMPPYVKIGLANAFPRSTVTSRVGRSPAVYYGPFRSRSGTERFASEFLDLFQVRRCQEDLEPSPAHPGCIYGEMGMCLRPCQQVVGPDEYGHEVSRAAEFLATRGASLLATIGSARDRFSEEMAFEEAARQHKRFEKVRGVLELSDELARHLDHLDGAAITASVEPGAVEMWFVRAGWWLGSRTLSFEVEEGTPVSLDRRLKETIATLEQPKLTTRERQEYLALLARWYYSSWREGEWIAFGDYQHVPWRKLVHAVSRVAHASA